jgi:hypothetical protein
LGLLDFYSASSLKQQYTGGHVAPLGLMFLFRANQFHSLLFFSHKLIYVREYRGQSKMDNPETLATLGTQDT